MPRALTDHLVAGSITDSMNILVLDEPVALSGGHEYEIRFENKEGLTQYRKISFQKGPVQEAGLNGIMNEHLVAIVIDRMRGFQSGPFACRENALALTKLEEALMWLQIRTRDRIARGVEGRSKL